MYIGRPCRKCGQNLLYHSMLQNVAIITVHAVDVQRQQSDCVQGAVARDELISQNVSIRSFEIGRTEA